MLDNITTKISYAANAVLALFGLLSLEHWAIIIGIVLTIATFFVNKSYRKKMLSMTEDHQQRMRNIQKGKSEQDKESPE